MARDRDTAFFGHPLGLATLFFTEMWERFSYYGIRALLILYMAADLRVGGRGMTEAAAGAVLGVYQSSVYLLSLPGGWIADRFLGQRYATLLGGLFIAGGNALLAIPVEGTFYPGLVMIAVGTGLLKPNVSAIVGQLYGRDDSRRDGGYTIYYMGINIGALIAPLACGYFAQTEGFRSFLTDHGINPNWCWHFGFAAASVGMLVGVVQYLFTQKWLGEAGKTPTVPSDAKRAQRDRVMLVSIVVGAVVIGVLFAMSSLSEKLIADIFGIGLAVLSVVLFTGMMLTLNSQERRRMVAVIVLFIGAIAFFGIFEQASSTLSLFAENFTERKLLFFTMPASYYQSVNSLFIIALAPLFAMLWTKLGRVGKEPTDVVKFSIGMALIAVSFIVMLPTLSAVGANARSSGWFLIALYFFSTCSELCISPVGLASMSRLAPPRLAGMVMGIWFLGTSIGNYFAGRAAEFSAARGFGFLFYFVIIAALVVAAALYFVSPVIRRMLERNKREEAELPKATVVAEV